MFSMINVFGLATSMAACLIIFQYVEFEYSYDDFRKPNVYRVFHEGFSYGESLGERAQSSPALSPAYNREIPEVEHAARLIHTDPLMPDPVMQVGENSFHESKIYFADPDFLEMFSYNMRSGNIKNALSNPDHVAISASMAQKYFPFQEPVGKSITLHQGERGSVDLKVSGVFEDIPANSHLHTDFLISFSTIPFNLDENWDWDNFYNYIELRPDADPAIVENKMAATMKKYRGDLMDAWADNGYRSEKHLTQIQNIHLDSHMEEEAEPNGSRQTVNFLMIIACFILVIAWINYLNLTVAKAVERAKEIGVRKVIGSSRRQLIGQFLSESLVVNLLAAAVAVIVSQLLLPGVRSLLGWQFSMHYNFELILIAFAILLAGTFLSGFYPSFILSAYRPLDVLKNKVTSSRGGVKLRKVLVAFQFAASIILIIGTFVVKSQLNFMRERDLGYDPEQMLVVKGPGMQDSTYTKHLSYFKELTNQLSGVKVVARSTDVPGKELSWGRKFYQSATPENKVGLRIVAIDEDFFDAYDMTFQAGRNFDKETATDRAGLIFNEQAIKELGFVSPESAIDQEVVWMENSEDEHQKQVVGVVKDYNQESLHKEVAPMVFVLKRYLNAPWTGEYLSIKLSNSNYLSLTNEIKDNWGKAFPNSPFEYFFLDEHFNQQYKSDQQFSRIFTVFSALAIIIALMGLFGLTSYITLQRTKEIGIRKVLGAKTLQIVKLFTAEYTVIVIVSMLIAMPIAYYFTLQWLSNFAFKANFSVWYFAVLGVVIIVGTWLIIGLQTLKGASVNPVECLKDE
ncbi:ABC transporter permease [Fulvivirga maritima]|uniref:ABC transporter permease n=1 Tax=Fulvivirga maritima TaxID=2904247 RepID=UPI001F271C51|nr:ABC transporter permease [Fulvivirga maritima]UII28052.1 ABC transporter permease [Fulvivirga maritima]